MSTDDHLGPPVRDVSVDDVQQLATVFAEQRARVAVVRENAIWQWFGGVPQGFGSPHARLHGIYLQLAFAALTAVALVVAGFTRGSWLWALLALAAACLAARALVTGVPARRTLRVYRRALLVPAIVVARRRDPNIVDADVPLVHALLVAAPPTPASFAALLAAAARTRRMLDGTELVPPELAGAVARMRAGGASASYDGSREAVPQLGERVELARFFVPPGYTPDDRLTSRLVFVLADPDDRSAGHTRVTQPLLWGPGGEALYRALPEESAP